MLEKILFLLFEKDIKYDLRVTGERQGWKKTHMILDIKTLELIIGIQNNGKRLSYYYGKYGIVRKGIPKKDLLEYLKNEINNRYLLSKES